MTEKKININIDDLDEKKVNMNCDYRNLKELEVDYTIDRFPNCIVWTPLPVITWLIPFIGHMGIATSAGIIRDFAGPYYVSENDMAFGKPTRYWQLDTDKIPTGINKKEQWDRAVADASDEYKTHMHNLCCDNCHSHVAMALNQMEFDRSTSWNMVNLCFLMLFKGSFVNFSGFLKTWLPFLIMVSAIFVISLLIGMI